jgi:hypothetical protein
MRSMKRFPRFVECLERRSDLIIFPSLFFINIMNPVGSRLHPITSQLKSIYDTQAKWGIVFMNFIPRSSKIEDSTTFETGPIA